MQAQAKVAKLKAQAVLLAKRLPARHPMEGPGTKWGRFWERMGP